FFRHRLRERVVCGADYYPAIKSFRYLVSAAHVGMRVIPVRTCRAALDDEDVFVFFAWSERIERTSILLSGNVQPVPVDRCRLAPLVLGKGDGDVHFAATPL